MMPKARATPTSSAAARAPRRRRSELGVELIWDGPTDPDPAKQNEVVEAWITRGVDVIAVSVENEARSRPCCARRAQRGIKVDHLGRRRRRRTPATSSSTRRRRRASARRSMDDAARVLGRQGRVRDHHRLADRRQPERVDQAHRGAPRREVSRAQARRVRPSDGDRDRAFAETQTVLKVHPDVKLIMAIAAPAVPGAAEAVKQSGRTDVKVIGLSPAQHVQALRPRRGHRLHRPLEHARPRLPDRLRRARPGHGRAHARARRRSRPAGSATIEVSGDQVLLGEPFMFTAENIDRFDF